MQLGGHVCLNAQRQRWMLRVCHFYALNKMAPFLCSPKTPRATPRSHLERKSKSYISISASSFKAPGHLALGPADLGTANFTFFPFDFLLSSCTWQFLFIFFLARQMVIILCVQAYVITSLMVFTFLIHLPAVFFPPWLLQDSLPFLIGYVWLG